MRSKPWEELAAQNATQSVSDRQTDGQTDKLKAISPVWGINIPNIALKTTGLFENSQKCVYV